MSRQPVAASLPPGACSRRVADTLEPTRLLCTHAQGHAGAIDVFESLLPSLPPGTELHLVGSMMQGHDEYVDELRRVSAGCVMSTCRRRVEGVPAEPTSSTTQLLPHHALRCTAPPRPQRAEGLPVHFHVAVPTAEILELLRSTLVQVWAGPGAGAAAVRGCKAGMSENAWLAAERCLLQGSEGLAGQAALCQHTQRAQPASLEAATHPRLRPHLAQWHLTGIELEPGADVASEEHFGISVAEGVVRVGAG